LDFDWFTDLAHLNQTRNFSQAAQRSHISQPAFSRRIKALESWVGTRLVDRSHHPVTLTVAGQQILEAGQQAIRRIENERDQIRAAQALPDKYVVTFGAQHSIGWRFYPTWLQQFEEEFGAIISRLRADDLPNCVAALKADEVDFVIAYESNFASSIAPFGSLQSVVIGTDSLIPVCKCDDNNKPLFSFDSHANVQIPYLRFGVNAPISKHFDPVLDAIGIRNKLVVVYENSMAGALRIRAHDGDGVAWLPKSLVKPDLDGGLLTQIGESSWEVPLQIRLHRLASQANPLTQKIWEFLDRRRAESGQRRTNRRH
jgi:DNA-binding transcriptional LysR family regulator